MFSSLPSWLLWKQDENRNGLTSESMLFAVKHYYPPPQCHLPCIWHSLCARKHAVCLITLSQKIMLKSWRHNLRNVFMHCPCSLSLRMDAEARCTHWHSPSLVKASYVKDREAPQGPPNTFIHTSILRNVTEVCPLVTIISNSHQLLFFIENQHVSNDLKIRILFNSTVLHL